MAPSATQTRFAADGADSSVRRASAQHAKPSPDTITRMRSSLICRHRSAIACSPPGDAVPPEVTITGAKATVYAARRATKPSRRLRLSAVVFTCQSVVTAKRPATAGSPRQPVAFASPSVLTSRRRLDAVTILARARGFASPWTRPRGHREGCGGVGPAKRCRERPGEPGLRRSVRCQRRARQSTAGHMACGVWRRLVSDGPGRVDEHLGVGEVVGGVLAWRRWRVALWPRVARGQRALAAAVAVGGDRVVDVGAGQGLRGWW